MRGFINQNRGLFKKHAFAALSQQGRAHRARGCRGGGEAPEGGGARQEAAAAHGFVHVHTHMCTSTYEQGDLFRL